MNRREVLAYLASLGLFSVSELFAISDKRVKKRIVIVGGGTGGVIAYALLKLAAPSLDLLLIAPNDKHLYQPGGVYVAAGVMQPQEMVREMWQFVDEKEHLKASVKRFEPQHNLLVTDTNEKITYDFLILALGIEPNFSSIDGIDRSTIGTRDITSIYLCDMNTGEPSGALMTRKWFEKTTETAKKRHSRVLFGKGAGHIKCGGAIVSTLYLLADHLQKNVPKENIDIHFATTGKRLFGLPRYNDVLMRNSKKYGTITHHFRHTLKAVDTKKKQAFFTMQRRIRDRYDPDFEEWSYKTVSKEVAIPYDFLHITPPMHPPQALRDSPLAVTSGTDKGYAHVDRDHMRHKIFGNVFAVGDCAGTPLGKTAFSAKNQALTVTRNILNILLHKPLVSYDGYSGCPIKLSYDNLLFAEFDYDGATKRLLNAPCIPKHSLWEYDRYRLPKHYWDWLHGEIHSS